MLFHVLAPNEEGFTKSSKKNEKRQYKLSIFRIIIGSLFFFGIIIAAFIANSNEWTDGTNVFLHMAEVFFGGFVGVIFGEKGAIAATKN